MPPIAASTAKARRKATGTRRGSAPSPSPRRILAIDIGGSGVKVSRSGIKTVHRIESGKRMTPTQLVRGVQAATAHWEYDAIALGFPGRVGPRGALGNPDNLGGGWVGFDFGKAFGVPVRIINDAAMQALGSYQGGRMLFLGLGTGLGTTLITERTIVSLELGRMLIGRRHTLGELVGKSGLKRLGRRKWRRLLCRIIPALQEAVMADYVVVGGGNVDELKRLRPGTRRGHNDNAIHGGFRLWDIEGVPLHPGARRPQRRSAHASPPWRSL